MAAEGMGSRQGPATEREPWSAGPSITNAAGDWSTGWSTQQDQPGTADQRGGSSPHPPSHQEPRRGVLWASLQPK